jgi:hypothetical protein
MMQFEASFGRWDRQPGGCRRSDKAEAPQSVRPPGAEKVPKQRPQTRCRKNVLKNGNAAQLGKKGQAEQREIRRAAG